MRKIGIAAVALSAVLSASAGAEDWTGASTVYPATTYQGPAVCGHPQNFYPVVLPPCPAGYLLFQPNGDPVNFFQPAPWDSPGPISSLPQGVADATSSVSIDARGVVADPTLPAGYRYITVRLPLSQFARSGTVDSLAGQLSSVSGSVASVSSTLGILQGQVTTLSASINNRLGLLETNVASLATSASVNALSGRVTSAEVQLASMQQDLSALATFIPEAMQEMQKEARAGAAMAASLETVAPAPGSKNRLGFNSANYNGETAFSVSYVRQEGQIDVSAGVAISGDEAMVKGGVGLSW